MFKHTRLLILFLVATMAFVVGAQDIEPFTPPAEDADIAITFPPPVFAVAGEVEIRGTVDSIGLSEYIIEYRELVEPPTDGTVVEESPWLPATRPGNQVVRNGVLGVWNTITARDGLYEIRLRATLETGAEELFRVSPVRVLNNPTADFVGLPLSVTLQPTPTQIGGTGSRPPLAATPTPLNTGEPTVVAIVDANVRSGDDTTYPRVGSLLAGESAPILGLSSFNSGWFYIQLPNGRRGFIAPSTVNATGDLNNLPPVEPPPPPTPPATATPITSANLQVTGIRLEPSQPVCNESFDIYINVANTGTGPSSASTTLQVIDRHVSSGTTTATTVGGFPVLNEGGNFVVVVTLTVNTFFEEDHEVIIQLDPENTVPETNEGDNFSSIRYVLDQGSCG